VKASQWKAGELTKRESFARKSQGTRKARKPRKEKKGEDCALHHVKKREQVFMFLKSKDRRRYRHRTNTSWGYGYFAPAPSIKPKLCQNLGCIDNLSCSPEIY
jgi:hypothetical protein